MLKRVPIYLASFFLSLHFATTIYVNSSFLETHFSSLWVSAIFILGAALNIFLFLKAPVILSHIRAKSFLIVSIILSAIASLGMAFSDTNREALIFFLIYSAALPLIYYCLDIFLENSTKNGDTGNTRGSYLTVLNAGIAAAPLAVAIFAVEDDLSQVYMASCLLILPVFVLALWFKDIGLRNGHQVLHAKEWWHTLSLRRVTMARFMLEFFYAIMMIHTPLYLRNVIGFEWNEIGVMFSIMLLPFVLFEWPVGELADRKFGEREFMVAGFFISGLSLLVMPFLGAVFLAWTATLFISRIGASFIEITTESYFFKHVDARDSGLISIFRLTRPAATIAGALVGLVTLMLLSYENIFFILAALLLLGLHASIRLKDTL